MLLSRLGYNGPNDPKMMEAFLQSNPAAAAKVGDFQSALQQPKVGMAEGGYTVKPVRLLGRTLGYSVVDSSGQLVKGFDASSEQAANDYLATLNTPTTSTPSLPSATPAVEPTTTTTETATTETTNPNALSRLFSNSTYAEQPSATESQTGASMPELTQGAADLAASAMQPLQEAEVAQIGEVPGATVAADTGTVQEPVTVPTATTVEGVETAPAPTPTEAVTYAPTTVTGTAGTDMEKLRVNMEMTDQLARSIASRYGVSDLGNQLSARYNKLREENPTLNGEQLDALLGNDPETVTLKGQMEEAQRKLNEDPKYIQLQQDQQSLFEQMRNAQEGTGVRGEVSKLTAAQGEVSQTVTPETMDPTALAQLGLDAAQIDQLRQVVDTGDLQVTPEQLAEAATLANQGIELPQAIAQVTGQPQDVVAAKFTTPAPEAEAQDQYNLPPTQSATQAITEVQDAAKAAEIPTAEEAQSSFQSTVEAAQGTVGASELVQAKDIVETAKAVEATAATVEALNEQSKVSAVKGTFSQEAFAKAAQGAVPASATVQGQMEKLMKQFDDGTPAWAAGAMRAANAAMAARGLGASSMAGAAIVQAAMEAATPIAAQDAKIFADNAAQNLANRQQVALANAAAQQGLELQNLSFQQQANMANSANAFALQSQNLSNEQAVVLANAQFKAALQGQTLDIKTQSAITNAARYAAVNDINLTNDQQARLLRSSQSLEVDMANLSNTQQTALANLQVRAAIAGQELTNEQQMAMLESSQEFERAGFDASAKQQAFLQDAQAKAALEGRAMDARQQTQLFNISNLIEERQLELTNEQQTRLFNSTQRNEFDLANLSNKQQTALANAQIEASLRGQELSNAQQVGVVNAARISEVANINFTADQQRALENSKLAQSFDIANLNASNAKVLADAAAMTNVDVTNLNNRQQAQVSNAQNFLSMDLANLSNEQQTSIFKTQQVVQSLFSDQAAENAAAQFNASSQNQVDQFYASLSTQVSQFNAGQQNAIAQFNAGQENAMAEFVAQQEQQRAMFNAQNNLIVAQANAQWRQNVATLDTAAQNDANMTYAKAMNGLSSAGLDQIWQRERDIMSYAFTATESTLDRNLRVLLADKDLQAVRDKLDAADESAKWALGYNMFFGDDDVIGTISSWTGGGE